MEFYKYSNIEVSEVLADLKTSESGLLAEEVILRQKKYGFNEVRSRSANVWDILMRQCSSPFFYLLLIAGLVAFFIGEKIDSVVIIVFIVLNVSLGFLQEFKAEKTISLLKNIIAQKVNVMRNGLTQTIDKKELVPGDIVLLSAGDIVPAELRAISLKSALVDESVLTGESAPVLKISQALPNQEKELFKSQNMLFAGTSVVAGSAKGTVVSTGENTELASIITSVSQKRPQGIYEKNLMYFCRLILKIVLATMLVIFLLNLLIKGTDTLFAFLLFCVALIVSILPEALPAIVILALSGGSMKMAKENVVVKRLSAIEDLGNIEILCTDKTGTLTENKLSLEKIISQDNNKSILYGLLGSDGAGKLSKNPFDSAIFARANYKVISDLKKYHVVEEFPFDSFRMRQSVLVEDKQGHKLLVTRGAPELLIKRCSKFASGFKKSELLQNIAKEGQDGKRVLAVAFKKITKGKVTQEDERGLTFLGYFVFEDPLKSTAQEAIKLAKKLGVQIKIITGDSKEVAGFVSKKTGIIANASEVFLGEELEKMGREEFNNACEDGFVFARVSPDIKHKIIKSLQRNFEVGFLGDGINDVPALKSANIAIAVSGASDVAKEASDVVLLKKDLRVIVNGIKDGRIIFANINKYIKCSLANNFGNFYSIAVISLFVNFLPMLPVQILLSNLLSDLPLISISTDSVDLDELRRPKMYQLHNVLPLIISLALVAMVFDFIFFTIFYKFQPSSIQTLWFIEGLLTDIVLIFIIRTRGPFWKARKPGIWLSLLTVISVIIIVGLPFTGFGQQFFHFVSVPFYGIFVVLLLLIGYVAASEIVKLVYFHYIPRRMHARSETKGNI